MGGGLMQLVAYGAQDVYLSGKPQITFWKLMYRRHTNFAIESIEQVFNGSPGFGKRASATISRNGDLITQVFLQITAPQLEQYKATDEWDETDFPVFDEETGTTVSGKTATGVIDSNYSAADAKKDWAKHSYRRYCNSFAHALLESCEIEIGGQRIDKHYSAYYEVLDELTCPEEKRLGYGRMVGKHYDPQSGKPLDCADAKMTDVYSQLDTHMGKHGPVTFYLPLRFWFNSNPGLALPLIALQYHEVKLQMNFRKLEDLTVFDVGLGPNVESSNDTSTTIASQTLSAWKDNWTKSADTGELTVQLYVDYVYLDTDERRRFAQVSHEYLIEQLQFTGQESVKLDGTAQTNQRVRLNFNHPCKELIFFFNRDTDTGKNQWFNFGENIRAMSSGDKVSDYKGYELLKDANLMLNGHERFQKRPGSYFRMVVPFQAHSRIPSRHIYVYSFALRPEEHQPSGSCNFSRMTPRNSTST